MGRIIKATNSTKPHWNFSYSSHVQTLFNQNLGWQRLEDQCLNLRLKSSQFQSKDKLQGIPMKIMCLYQRIMKIVKMPVWSFIDIPSCMKTTLRKKTLLSWTSPKVISWTLKSKHLTSNLTMQKNKSKIVRQESKQCWTAFHSCQAYGSSLESVVLVMGSTIMTLSLMDLTLNLTLVLTKTWSHWKNAGLFEFESK